MALYLDSFVELDSIVLNGRQILSWCIWPYVIFTTTFYNNIRLYKITKHTFFIDFFHFSSTFLFIALETFYYRCIAFIINSTWPGLFLSMPIFVYVYAYSGDGGRGGALYAFPPSNPYCKHIHQMFFSCNLSLNNI